VDVGKLTLEVMQGLPYIFLERLASVNSPRSHPRPWAEPSTTGNVHLVCSPSINVAGDPENVRRPSPVPSILAA